MTAPDPNHFEPRLAAGRDATMEQSGVQGKQAGQLLSEIAGLSAAQARWLVENRGALQSSNEFVDRWGLPLARYRNF